MALWNSVIGLENLPLKNTFIVAINSSFKSVTRILKLARDKVCRGVVSGRENRFREPTIEILVGRGILVFPSILLVSRDKERGREREREKDYRDEEEGVRGVAGWQLDGAAREVGSPKRKRDGKYNVVVVVGEWNRFPHACHKNISTTRRLHWADS